MRPAGIHPVGTVQSGIPNDRAKDPRRYSQRVSGNEGVIGGVKTRRRPHPEAKSMTSSWREDFFDRGPRGIRGYFSCILRGSRLSFLAGGLDVARGVTCFSLWKEPGNELAGRLCWSNGSARRIRPAGYYYTLSGSGDSSQFSRTLAETFILDPDAVAVRAWL